MLYELSRLLVINCPAGFFVLSVVAFCDGTLSAY